MAFKEEIKQEKFKNPQIKAALNLIYSANHFENLMRRMLKPFDLTHEQFNVLRILRGNHPDAYELNEIRDRMLNSWSNVSRLVEKLRKKGHVTRQPKKENRRKVEIKITDKGLQFLSKIDESLVTDHLLAEALSEEKAEILSQLLDELRVNLDERVKESEIPKK